MVACLICAELPPGQCYLDSGCCSDGCSAAEFCARGATPDGIGTCQPRATAGQMCRIAASQPTSKIIAVLPDCAPGLYCREIADNGDFGICQRYVHAAAGEPCAGTITAPPAPDRDWRPEGRVRYLPSGTVPDTTALVTDLPLCALAENLYCHPVSLTCHTVDDPEYCGPENGHNCTGDRYCDAPVIKGCNINTQELCPSGKNRCVARRADGESCGLGDECVSGYCTGGHCARRGPPQDYPVYGDNACHP